MSELHDSAESFLRPDATTPALVRALLNADFQFERPPLSGPPRLLVGSFLERYQACLTPEASASFGTLSPEAWLLSFFSLEGALYLKEKQLPGEFPKRAEEILEAYRSADRFLAPPLFWKRLQKTEPNPQAVLLALQGFWEHLGSLPWAECGRAYEQQREKWPECCPGAARFWIDYTLLQRAQAEDARALEREPPGTPAWRALLSRLSGEPLEETHFERALRQLVRSSAPAPPAPDSRGGRPGSGRGVLPSERRSGEVTHLPFGWRHQVGYHAAGLARLRKQTAEMPLPERACLERTLEWAMGHLSLASLLDDLAEGRIRPENVLDQLDESRLLPLPERLLRTHERRQQVALARLPGDKRRSRLRLTRYLAHLTRTALRQSPLDERGRSPYRAFWEVAMGTERVRSLGLLVQQWAEAAEREQRSWKHAPAWVRASEFASVLRHQRRRLRRSAWAREVLSAGPLPPIRQELGRADPDELGHFRRPSDDQFWDPRRSAQVTIRSDYFGVGSEGEGMSALDLAAVWVHECFGHAHLSSLLPGKPGMRAWYDGDAELAVEGYARWTEWASLGPRIVGAESRTFRLLASLWDESDPDRIISLARTPRGGEDDFSYLAFQRPGEFLAPFVGGLWFVQHFARTRPRDWLRTLPGGVFGDLFPLWEERAASTARAEPLPPPSAGEGTRPLSLEPLAQAARGGRA